MSAQLAASDFARFFEALYGYPPFPWQVRLAEQVCEMGRLPALLDLPTGTGKTACIDIALFHLAYSLAAGGRRDAPLRIAWVVDRRLIVDEAYDRASAIAEKLESATDGILKIVADLFRGIAGEGVPLLAVQRLRGGIPREGDWARTPTQPTVVSSTVDQVGSRLLFRGYGVSPTMRPVHAGLLGEDALVVLDEVHLSEPFRQTLQRIASHERLTHAPWHFVQLSATPGPAENGEPAFGLATEDRAHPVLRRRLAASKPATLVRLGRLHFGSMDHADRFATEALARTAFEGAEGAKNVLVVVNRIELARRVHERILDHLRKAGRVASVTRLIGRGRDIEKDAVRDEIVLRCKSDATETPRAAQPTPYIVVATQGIEAGADLDFDALVTQIAPIDALRQRFGRLNRMGRPITVAAAILAVDTEIAASAKPDPIYGLASRETWKWLEARVTDESGGVVDFAAEAMILTADERTALRSPTQDAPVLMPEHLSAFSRTSPAPGWSPDPSLYLHGAPNAPADVNVIWRADLPHENQWSPDGNDRQLEEYVGSVTRLLGLVPPRLREVVAMPVSTVRRWLRGEVAGDAADVEIDVGGDADAPACAATIAWRWRGADEDVELIRDGNVRPGDTIVVPSSAGGCDRFGWNPRSGIVADLADEAAAPYVGRTYAVRLHRSLLEQELRRVQPIEDAGRDTDSKQTEALLLDHVAREWREISAAISEVGNGSGKDVVAALLGDESQPGVVLPTRWREALAAFDLRRGRVAIEWVYARSEDEDHGQNGVILFAKRGIKVAVDAVAASESATESDSLGSQGRRDEGESLVHHLADVRDRAREFTERLRMPKALADDVALAAYLHDLGKADERFQRYLAGNPWGHGKTLAKSGKRRTAREDAAARQAAGLPDGWRHEALSVRIAREHPDFADAHDPELVLWLIGTHHGFGRPQFPHAEPRDDERREYRGFTPYDTDALSLDSSPGPQRVDFELCVASDGRMVHVDWQTMFTRLEKRYGIWGLAWLEAIVRLADHRASEAIAEYKKEALA